MNGRTISIHRIGKFRAIQIERQPLELSEFYHAVALRDHHARSFARRLTSLNMACPSDCACKQQAFTGIVTPAIYRWVSRCVDRGHGKHSPERFIPIKALMILTSHAKLGGTDHATGVWFEELPTPVWTFTDAGARRSAACSFLPERLRPSWADTAELARFPATSRGNMS